MALDRSRRRAETARARAAALVVPDHAFLTGRTAAIVAYGLPVAPGEFVDVAVFAPHRAPRREGIHAVKVLPGHATVREYEGLRVASPATTWAMLGATLSVRELVIVGDAIVRIPRGPGGVPQPEEQLATAEQLQAAIDAGRRPGIRRLRAALPHLRTGSMSPLETDFRLLTTAAGLPEPRLDVEIRDAHGRVIGIADAVYEEQRVIAEVEGDHHRTSRAQWNRDIEKYAALTAEGWEVVRLTGAHIRGGAAPRILREALVRRGRRP